MNLSLLVRVKPAASQRSGAWRARVEPKGTHSPWVTGDPYHGPPAFGTAARSGISGGNREPVTFVSLLVNLSLLFRKFGTEIGTEKIVILLSHQPDVVSAL